MADAKAKSLEHKAKGNGHLKAQEFEKAIEEYTKAIALDGSNHVFFSNRSAAYLSKGDAASALKDADKCIGCNPQWPKGYGRKGAALHKLRMYQKAVDAYQQGLKIDSNNAMLTSGLQAVIKEASSSQVNMIFQPGYMEKLKANSKTAKHLEDPSFAQMLNMMTQQPQLFNMLIPQSQQLRDCVQVLTGQNVDHLASPESMEMEKEMTSKRAADEEAEREERRRRQAKQSWAPKAREKTDEEKKKEAEEKAAEAAAASDPALLKRKADALAEKEEGTKLYKQKKFDEAIVHYEKAAEVDPDEMVYFLNIAAAMMGLKRYDDAIAQCEKGISVGRSVPSGNSGGGTFAMVAKAYSRIGTCYAKTERYDQAIKAFDNSLLENYDKGTEKKLKKAKKDKKLSEERAYLNPEEGALAKARGNEHFKAGDWKSAIQEYSDAIKRDPKNATYYCNRAAAYTKLMEFEMGLNDCSKAIQLNPNYVKAYGRKGTIEFFLKKLDKAMGTYKQGLSIDPHDETCKQGLQRTVNKINTDAMSGKQDPERLAEAMKDPEVQAIMRDPVIQSVLQEMQTSPGAAQKHMANPDIRRKIDKLIASGILGIGGPGAQ